MFRIGMALLLLLLAIAPLADAMDMIPQPRQFTEVDGLRNSNVNQIAQDRQGYIWLAMHDGVVRYDGSNFKRWLPEKLRDAPVMGISVDHEDRVWIGLRNGYIGVIDQKRENLQFLDMPNQAQLSREMITQLVPCTDGSLWVVGIHAIYRRGPDGAVTVFELGKDVPDGEGGRSRMYQTPDGDIWYVATNALMRWTGTGFESFPLGKLSISISAMDSEGTLVFWAKDGTYVHRADGTIVKDASFSYEPSIYPLALHDQAGGYWSTTANGVLYADAGVSRDVQFYSRSRKSLVVPYVTDIYEDREGGVWFASIADGLWYLPSTWKQFSVMPRNSNDSRISLHTISTAASVRGGVWMVGVISGLDYLQPGDYKLVRKISDLGMDECETVYEDSRGMVWIGCTTGVARFDPSTGSIRLIKDGELRYLAEFFAEATDGTLWFYSRAFGLLQHRDVQGRLLATLPVEPPKSFMPGHFVLKMALGPDGRIWICGGLGVFALEPALSRFVQVPGAPSERVNAFLTNADGTIWISTQGRVGKYRWNGQALEAVDHVDATNGFPDVNASGIMLDKEGVLWATGVHGLVRTDLLSKAVRFYTVKDGLPGNTFYSDTLRQTSDGSMVGSTRAGLVTFDPRQLSAFSEPSRVNLVVDRVDFSRGKERIDASGQAPLTMKHGDRDLHVVARLLSFNMPELHNYRFRLQGYESDWVEVGAGGERTFSLLPSGTYQLEVQARSAGAPWSDSRHLDIEVMPAWWGSGWGVALFALAGALLLLWAAYLYRKWFDRRNAWRLAQHRQALAEQASEAKTRFLATLGHEVRTPMTGVLGMSELLLATSLDNKQRRYTNSIRHAGTHLLQLVNDALDLARIEAGRLELDKQPFDFRQMMGEVVALMSPLAQNKKLAFDIENPIRGPMVVVGDVVRVRQVLLNLLGNAVKFTETGGVTLRVSRLQPEGIRFEVADTGPGINAEQQKRLFERFEQADGARTTARYGGSGLGLAICQELTAAMGGHISVESEAGAGSRFVVDLPLTWTQASERSQVASNRGNAKDLPALSILLVEDDPTVAEVIVGLLQVRGHRVRHAPHSLAALSESIAEHFDVALLDLDLPGMDGLALARQFHASGHTMPLIAVTARADSDAEPEAREAGFDGFLRKPLTGDMLIDAITAVLVVD